MPSSAHNPPNDCGSCVPSMTNTTPFKANVMTCQTLVETMFMRAVEGFKSCGTSDIVIPQATTRITPLTPICSPKRYAIKGVMSSSDTWNVVFSRPRSRIFSINFKSATPKTMPTINAPKNSMRNSRIASAAENVPVTTAATAN